MGHQGMPLTVRQIKAIREIKRTGRRLKGMPHGVYRSLVIRGVIRATKDGYELTEK
jgi:hypothetical protein